MRRIRTIICLMGLLALLCTSGRAQIVGPNGGTVASGGTINPGVLTAPAGSAGTIAQYSVNGEVNVASPTYVANPRTSAVVSTTAVTNGTTAVTLGAADGFVNGEGIAIYGAGANCNINSTDCGSITMGQATVVQTGYAGANGGTTITYQYTCTATDAAFGAPAAGAASVSVNGPAVLSEPNTAMGAGAVGTGGNYNTVTCPAQTGAVHYVWWRNAAGAGNALWAITDTNVFKDWINHQSITTIGPFNNTPPAAAQADVLSTTVASGAGTTSIVLTAGATQTGTFTAWPDATAAFQGAYNALTGGGTLRVPTGFYKLRSVTPKHGVYMWGAGSSINATSLGTILQGTSGYDMFAFTPSVSDSAFGWRDLKASGGRNIFADVFPGNGGALTEVTLDNLFVGADYAVIFAAGSIEEWWANDVYFTGGWYGIDQETTAQAATNNYIQKSSFTNCHYNSQQVNGIHLNGVTQTDQAITFKRSTFQGTLHDAIWIEAPTQAIAFEGLTDEGIGSDFTRVTRATATNPCTNGSNVIAMTNTTGLAVGQDVTIYSCGANSFPLEGTICALTVNTSITLQDAACSVNQNAGTTQTVAVTMVAAPFDNLFWITNGGSAAQNSIKDAVFTVSGGCCGQTQTRYQVFDRTAGIITYNLSANNVAFPSGVTQQFGTNSNSNVSIHPTVTSQGLTAGALQMSTAAPAGGPNFSIITSGAGGDFDIGLVDSTSNGSGTFGQWGFYRNDSARTKIFSIDGTSGHIAWRQAATGNVPTVLLNGCGTIAAGNVTSGTDTVGTETVGTTGTTCAIHFATSYSNAPPCLCDDQTTHSNFQGCTATASILTITVASNTGDVLKWFCPATF